MPKYYDSNFDIPDCLKKSVKKVSSNLGPNQRLGIDAKSFVALFRDDIERWVAEDNAMNEKDQEEKKTPKEKTPSTKKKTRLEKMLKKEEIVEILIKYSKYDPTSSRSRCGNRDG